MDKKMKCTNCGSHELVRCGIPSEGGGELVSVRNAETYACKQCRHVEFFLLETEIQAIAVREKKQADYEDQVKQYEQKKAALQKQIDELRRVVSDENQTVKAVNEAKEKVMQLENELRNLRKPGNPYSLW